MHGTSSQAHHIAFDPSDNAFNAELVPNLCDFQFKVVPERDKIARYPGISSAVEEHDTHAVGPDSFD
jgi:hypothetical protein